MAMTTRSAWTNRNLSMNRMYPCRNGSFKPKGSAHVSASLGMALRARGRLNSASEWRMMEERWI